MIYTVFAGVNAAGIAAMLRVAIYHISIGHWHARIVLLVTTINSRNGYSHVQYIYICWLNKVVRLKHSLTTV